jgi:hypothetical protein
MKIKSLFLLLAIIPAGVNAQSEKFTKFYNKEWKPSSKEDAFYVVEFVKKDTLYHTTSHFISSYKLEGRGIYADTAFTQPRALNTSYNEEGILTDSAFYFPGGETMFRYHYYETGKLNAVYTGNDKGEELSSKGYDESGKEIKDFIFEKEAEYPGGAQAWIRFISNNVKSKVPIKNKAPNGTYTVIIKFIVDKNGQVADLKPETNLGYGMEEEAIRVISKSPKWINAIQNNKPVNAYRRQPLTFVVQ